MEVNEAAVETKTDAAQVGLTARNVLPALPIEKAKPLAKEEALAKLQAQETSADKKLSLDYLEAGSARALQKHGSKQSQPQDDKNSAAQWRLIDGTLQRSLDAGGSWRIVFQLQHPLLAYGVRGSDIWVGGQAGTLFHSADSGATWTMVQPSTKSAALSSDIVGIDVRSANEIVLSTSNASWTTNDAGKTWEKK